MKLLIVLLALFHFGYSANFLNFDLNSDDELEFVGDVNQIFGENFALKTLILFFLLKIIKIN
jgi:hypothetical protein